MIQETANITGAWRFKKFNLNVQMNKKTLELYREYQSGKLEVNELISQLADLCERENAR